MHTTNTCYMNQRDRVGKMDQIHVIAAGATSKFKLVPFDSQIF